MGADRESFGLRAVVAAVLLAGLAGCQTVTLDKVGAFQDPRVGYLAAGAMNDGRGQQRYARLLADTHFAQVRLEPVPATLPALAEYRQALQRPIRVSLPERAQQDMQKLTEADIMKMKAYMTANPGKLEVDGARHSSDWAGELAKVEKQVMELSQRKASLLKRAEAAAGAGDYRTAFRACLDAGVIDPEDSTIRVYKEKWIGPYADQVIREVQKEDLPAAEAIQEREFGKPTSRVEFTKDCDTILDKAQQELTTLKQILEGDAAFRDVRRSRSSVLEKVETRMADARGKTWGERLRLLSDQKQYWAAYEYATVRGRELATSATHVKTALANQLAVAYGKMLPQGMEYFVGTANDYFASDAFGLACVFCRMAEEMIQYARKQGFVPTAEAQTWELRAGETRRDAQKKLQAAMTRKLIIAEFLPDDPEGQNLGRQTFDDCVRRYEQLGRGEAPVAWGVKVERGSKEYGPLDYVIEGNLRELSIEDLAPRELSREVIEVGRDITQVPNPKYKPKSDLPKMVFEQKVFMYQRITQEVTKQARVRVDLAVTHQSQKKILTIDSTFPNDKTSLPGITLVGTEDRLDIPFIGPPRISASRAALTVDEWPQARAPKLSSESNVKDALREHVRARIRRTLDDLMGTYPVNVLAATASRQQRLGNHLESANAWGQCLEYCYQLTVGYRVSEDRTKVVDWFRNKEEMLKQIAENNSSLWQETDQALRARLANIWDVSVGSALGALKEKGR